VNERGWIKFDGVAWECVRLERLGENVLGWRGLKSFGDVGSGWDRLGDSV
jgi:hypothetical protein